MVGISLRASEPLLGLPGLLSSVRILTSSQVTVMLPAPGHTLTAAALEHAPRQASATSPVCRSPRGSEAPPGARPNPTGFTGAWDKASDPLCTCPSVTLAGRPGAWVLSPEGTSDVPAPFSHHLCVPREGPLHPRPHLLFPPAQPCALFTVSPVGILPALLLHQAQPSGAAQSPSSPVSGGLLDPAAHGYGSSQRSGNRKVALNVCT